METEMIYLAIAPIFVIGLLFGSVLLIEAVYAAYQYYKEKKSQDGL